MEAAVTQPTRSAQVIRFADARLDRDLKAMALKDAKRNTKAKKVALAAYSIRLAARAAL